MVKQTKKQLNDAAEFITTARKYGTWATSTAAIFTGSVVLKEIINTQRNKNFDPVRTGVVGGLATAAYAVFAHFAHDNLKEIRYAAENPLPSPDETEAALWVADQSLKPCVLDPAPEQ